MPDTFLTRNPNFVPSVEPGSGGDTDNWWDGLSLEDIGKFFGKVGTGVLNAWPGSDGSNMASAFLPAAMAAAYKQWQDAGKYKDTAQAAMKYGDPFGQANRDKYQQMLAMSYEHPEQVLNDPAHQAMLKSGLDTVSRQNASKGYLGSGNMEADLAAYTSNLDNQFLTDYRKGLVPLTGNQFDPAQAGKFLMQGNEQAIASQNSALSSLFMPFLQNATNNHITNNGNGAPGGGTPTTPTPGGNVTPPPGQVGPPSPHLSPPGSPENPWSNYNTTPQQAAAEIATITKSLGGTAASIWNAMLGGQYQDISPSTRELIHDLALNQDTANVPINQIFNEGVGGYTTPPVNPGLVDYPVEDYGLLSRGENGDTGGGDIGGGDYGGGGDFGGDIPLMPEPSFPDPEIPIDLDFGLD